jgi:multicomponent K+:H+ antiporter subunit F
MILALALNFAIACFGLAILMNLWVILRGPLIADRILALDTLSVNALAIVVLYGVRILSAVNFELAILIAMTGFVSTVALARFHLRGNVVE